MSVKDCNNSIYEQYKLGAKWAIIRPLILFTDVIKVSIINNPYILHMLIISMLFTVLHFTYVNR